MKRTHFRIIALCLALLLTLQATAALAENDANWWEEDVWQLDTLVELGAVLPDYNAADGVYEIASAEQLLYLSGTWKTDDSNGDGAPDAPCDGHYALTADIDMVTLMEKIGTKLTSLSGKKTEGYMPPIAALSDETAEGGVNCAFFGVFDGQGHTVSNMRIVRMNDKYAGFFGNVGHDYGEGFVKDLALVNIRVEAKASAGLLAGALYGDADNCVVTGSLVCNEKTAGGLAGKVKKNDNSYVGTVRNCFIYADITVLGTGNENGAAGGVTSAQSDGGRIYNCYVAGSISVEGAGADCVGGISGNLKSGQALENNVMLLTDISVEDGTHIGLLCGDYSGESGSHLNNNAVWEGTKLTGNVSSEHPETAAYRTESAATLTGKAYYTDTMGWDFDTVWTWIGDENNGCPMIAEFAGRSGLSTELAGEITSALTIDEPVVRATEPMVNSGYEGDDIEIRCAVFPAAQYENADAKLYYGESKDAAALENIVQMEPVASEEGGFVTVFPERTVGTWYYRMVVKLNGREYAFPTQGTLRLDIISAASKYAPEKVNITPGKTYESMGFNWTTEADGLTSELRYRLAGGSEWTTVPVTEQNAYEVEGGRGTFTGYSVDMSGLSASSEYEYMAVTNDGERDYNSEIYTFTTLPDGNGYSFMVISDLQATAEEGYEPFKYTMEGFVAEELGGVDFIVNLGDLTEDGSSLAQWQYMFDTVGGVYAATPTAYVAGNHESKGDAGCTVFEGSTNLPGGLDDANMGETTGCFIVGDVCIVIMNTEPYSGLAGADTAADRTAYYEAQKAWAKEVFEESGCTWRIIASHAGLIQDDAAATAFIEAMCDELNVDLYFNGHIHDYYRATVRNGAAAEVGEGTTYITTSPMGCKFDDFETGVIDDVLQFQTGGSTDERQYFTLVTVTDGGIDVTAYQRTEPGDPTDAKLFSDYTVIDTISLSAADKTAAAQEPASGDTEEEADGIKVVSTNTWLIIGIAACVLIIGAIAAIFIIKSRKAAKENDSANAK